MRDAYACQPQDLGLPDAPFCWQLFANKHMMAVDCQHLLVDNDDLIGLQHHFVFDGCRHNWHQNTSFVLLSLLASP